MDKFLIFSSSKNQNGARSIPAVLPNSNPIENSSIIEQDELSLSTRVDDDEDDRSIEASVEPSGTRTGKKSRIDPPTFSPDNILSLTTRVPISSSIYLSILFI